MGSVIKIAFVSSVVLASQLVIISQPESTLVTVTCDNGRRPSYFLLQLLQPRRKVALPCHFFSNFIQVHRLFLRQTHLKYDNAFSTSETYYKPDASMFSKMSYQRPNILVIYHCNKTFRCPINTYQNILNGLKPPSQ
jgi:hypothetical protein